MGKRRAKGEGTIVKRPDGLWMAQITLGEGKRKTKYGKTQQEVKDWLLTQRGAYKDGVIVANEKVTVGEFLDKWMEDVAKYSLRETTYITHESIIRNHIKPTLGSVRLVQLTPSHLQNLYSQKLKDGLSKRTVKYIHTIIHQLLNQALKWNLVTKNVAEAVDVPPLDKHPVEPLTVSQVTSLFKVLENDRLYPLLILFISTGLRRSEALGLKWQNVDLINGIIYIKEILINVKGKVKVGEPKTQSSRRVIALPDYAKSVMIDHKLRQTVESEYVFCTKNGTPFSPRNILRYFKNTFKEAGLPATTRIHDLRHFFVSYALSQGVPVKDVQGIVGHADFSTTVNIYGHLMQGAQKEAAKKMDRLFEDTTTA